MAGDWIKVEKATPGKSEVLTIARLLKIHRLHALGLCIEFWIWCDNQMDDGHAKSVTHSDIDEMFNVSGLASALVTVGWLRYSGEGVDIPNFDLHLGETAKKRAQAARRKQRERQADNTCLSRNERDKSVTREEKRRVNTHTRDEAVNLSNDPSEESRNEPEYHSRRDSGKDLILPPIALERLKSYTPEVQAKAWSAAHQYREFCPGQKGTALMADFAAALADVVLEGGEEWLSAYFTPQNAVQIELEVKAGKRLPPSASPWDVAKLYRTLHKKPGTSSRPPVVPSNPTGIDPTLERLRAEKAAAEKNAAAPGSFTKGLKGRAKPSTASSEVSPPTEGGNNHAA